MTNLEGSGLWDAGGLEDDEQLRNEVIASLTENREASKKCCCPKPLNT